MVRKISLVEVESTTCQLLEADKVGGDQKFTHFIAEIQRAGVKNRNGRVYPLPIVEREIAKLQTRINDKTAFGEADHPEKTPSISRTGVLWEKFWMNPDGRVFGQAKVIETAVGKDLKAILEAGGRVGVSSRSRGTVRQGEWNGEQAEIVNDDLEMHTFDVVADPSVVSAVSDKVFVEQTQEKSDMDIKTLAEFQEKYPDLHKQLVREAVQKASAQFEPTVNAVVERKTTEIRAQVMNELREKGLVLDEASRDLSVKGVALGKALVAMLTEAGFIEKGEPSEIETKKQLEGCSLERRELKAVNEKLTEALSEANSMLEAIEVDRQIDEAVAGHPLAEDFKATLIEACDAPSDFAEKLPALKERFDRLAERAGKPGEKPRGLGNSHPNTKPEKAPAQVLNEQKSKSEPVDAGKEYQMRAAGVL